ncbi:neuronal acetylcholine receptor subunit beta-3-like, partial [Ylistrum balloti]|uniref:neuronal acetylcholine receptor subunit beta-3-like n=1 Tax=Ylistrum balloti TaxID=509963 RepID=UPI002905D09F
VSDLEIMYDGITPIRIFPSGSMEWLPLRNFALHCDTNPTYYPFDTQTCPIAITAWSYTDSLIDLAPSADPVFSLDFYHENGEWEYVRSSKKTKTIERAGHETLTVTISPTFRRRPQFYVMNTIIPILILGILNGFIFSLSVDSGEKMGFVLTVLLAYAVYLTLVADHIPTTSESISVLSILLLLILMMSVFSVIASIYVIRFHGRSDDVPIPDATRKVIRIMASASFWKGCFRCKKRTSTVKDGKNGENKEDVDDKPTLNQEKSWIQEIPESEEDWNDLTWKEVADIIDHFGFVWYFTITAIISGCCIILMLYGYVNVGT